jgi:paired amphipathic helix protein Sin3a
MIQNIRCADTVSSRDIIRYRREAERLVGVEDPLYRIEWVGRRKSYFWAILK